MLRTPFKLPSHFTEHFGTTDMKTFRGVFKMADTAKGPSRYGQPQYQKWVRTVLEVFAERMGVPFSVAVQAFKTGDALAIHRWHRRRMDIELTGDSTGVDTQLLIGDMTADDFMQKFHKDWSFCLMVRHPDEKAYTKVMHSISETV